MSAGRVPAAGSAFFALRPRQPLIRLCPWRALTRPRARSLFASALRSSASTSLDIAHTAYSVVNTIDSTNPDAGMGKARRSAEGKRQEAETRQTMIYKRGCNKKGPNGGCSKCGEKGSCGVYWYKFMWNGTLVRESTRQGNDKVARQMEAAHRTSLAKGEVGIREKKVAPTLKEFCTQRIEPWAKATFEETCPNNWFWFRAGIRRLTAYDNLAKAKLDDITNEKVSGFVTHEQTRLQNRGRGEGEEKRGMAVSSINSSIRVLRRVLRLGVERGLQRIRSQTGSSFWRAPQRESHNTRRGESVSSRGPQAPRGGCNRSCGHWHAAARVLSAALGKYYVVEWSQRHTSGDTWENSGRSPSATTQPAREARFGDPMDED